jgi:hypothetical protein
LDLEGGDRHHGATFSHARFQKQHHPLAELDTVGCALQQKDWTNPFVMGSVTHNSCLRLTKLTLAIIALGSLKEYALPFGDIH